MPKEDCIGALTISEFCQAHRLGRTFVYQEIKSGRLPARKAGSKTLIFRQDAKHWGECLPRLVSAAPAEAYENEGASQ